MASQKKKTGEESAGEESQSSGQPEGRTKSSWNAKGGAKAREKPSMDKNKPTAGAGAGGAPVVDADMRFIVRIAGVDLDGNRPVRQALLKIKGVGNSYANAVVNTLGLDPTAIIGKFSDADKTRLEDAIKNPASIGLKPFMFNRRRDPTTGDDQHLVGADFVATVKRDVEFMKRIKCYRGVRHFYGLKSRGQRTKSRGAAFAGRGGKTVGVVRGLAKQVAAKKEEEKKE